ncbi:MAG: sigma-70 family RNA polymerase sigma factor [Mariniblastus sp.]|nr:sigma-70 family RNA polymerase sigma factor [Mariniblastus sp.]
MNNPRAKHEDREWICQTIDGDTESFGLLVRKYQDRLYNGMVQILRNESEAEDVVQDAFVLAFSKLDSFQGKSAFFTWLYRIAYNVAITRLRRRKRGVSLDGDDSRVRLDFPDSGPLPNDSIEKREEAIQLYDALDRLSSEHRSILVLREMEELDYDAIAEILELPVGTVRSRLHRARIRLRELLEKVMNQNSDG